MIKLYFCNIRSSLPTYSAQIANTINGICT